jgi:hypothetical protein
MDMIHFADLEKNAEQFTRRGQAMMLYSTLMDDLLTFCRFRKKEHKPIHGLPWLALQSCVLKLEKLEILFLIFKSNIVYLNKAIKLQASL